MKKFYLLLSVVCLSLCSQKMMADELADAQTAYQTALDSAKAVYNSTNYDYSNVFGKEMTSLGTAITNYSKTYTTADEYNEAASALLTATAGVVDAEPYYSQLYTEVPKALNIGVEYSRSAQEYGFAGEINLKMFYMLMTNSIYKKYLKSASVDLVKRALDSLYVREHVILDDSFTYDVTPTKMSFTENVASRSGQHWDGTTTSTYYEMNEGWGQSSWNMSYGYSVKLPAGNYLIKAAGRSALKAKATMECNGNKETFPFLGDTGLGIDVSGYATFSADSTYANANEGRGWQYRFILLTLDEEQTVDINFAASANELYQWASITSFQILSDSEKTIETEPEEKAERYTWFNDLESDEGLTIVGGGEFVDYGGKYGRVYKNVATTARQNYLLLPDTVLAQSAVSKELSIAFWVTAEGYTPDQYTYSPFFSAYQSTTPGSDNTWPMMVLQSRGLVQENCNGWCDFGNDLSVAGSNSIYNTNSWEASSDGYTNGGNWLEDQAWHYYTVVFTETSCKVYLDGVVKNEWAVDGVSDGQVIGLLASGNLLQKVCLGGNQAWNWGDADSPFMYDDVLITNYVLTPDTIAQIMAAKTAEEPVKIIVDGTEVEVVSTITVPVEIDEKTAYSGDTAEFDVQAVSDALGIESINTAAQYILNCTDLTAVANTTDGWRNADGDAATWASAPAGGVCVKIDTPSSGSINYIGCYDDSHVAGDVYTAKWGFVANGKAVVIDVVITFKGEEVTNLSDYENAGTFTAAAVSLEPNSSYGSAYTTTTFDAAAVAAALGISDLSEAEQYILNVTDNSLVKNTTDGWRDANGDRAAYGTEGGVCVKINEPTSGVVDYIGCFDTTHNDGESYTAKWAFVANGKVAVVDVVVTFTSADGIESINGDEMSEKAMFDLSGRRVNSVAKGNVYIINGKKVMIK